MIKKFERFINRLITHPRDRSGPPIKTPGDYGIRLFIHAAMFPIVTAILCVDPIGGPLVLCAFAYTFNKYQRNEDAHTEDQAWKDQAGFLWALALGVILYLIIKRWL